MRTSTDNSTISKSKILLHVLDIKEHEFSGEKVHEWKSAGASLGRAHGTQRVTPPRLHTSPLLASLRGCLRTSPIFKSSVQTQHWHLWNGMKMVIQEQNVNLYRV